LADGTPAELPYGGPISPSAGWPSSRPAPDPAVTDVPLVAERAVGIATVAEGLREFVEQEIAGVRREVARLASQPPPMLKTATLTVNDDMARRLLDRISTLMREERFRGGKLR
jgi:hypothetical protein